jgi:molybdopterin-guanine dinucleotide biosynthesis protein
MANDLKDLFGYKTSNVRLAVDGRATAYGILSRIQSQLKLSSPGDSLIVHLSGHGTQVASRDDYEVDGLDEVFCPIDFNFDDDSTWILDDDLVAILKSKKDGVTVVVISDSCHSGDLIDAGTDRQMKLSASKFLTPPMDHQWRIKSTDRAIDLFAAKSSTIPGVVLISGCKSSQTSADAYLDGMHQGACTWALRKNLRDTPSATLRQIVNQMRADLVDAGFDQVPQISGDSKVIDNHWPR